MSGLPWGKFFWRDWLTDPALSVCSLAAQGLWMRMLCIMSMAEPAGHLLLPPGRKAETEAQQVARMCLADARHVRMLLDELETRGVYSRNEAGIIISRRMIRDAAISESGRKHASKRWRPNRGPNGGNGRHATEPDRTDPMPDSDSDSESPPRRGPRSKSKNAAADILAETLRAHAGPTIDGETEDAEAIDPRRRGQVLDFAAKRAVRE